MYLYLKDLNLINYLFSHFLLSINAEQWGAQKINFYFLHKIDLLESLCFYHSLRYYLSQLQNHFFENPINTTKFDLINIYYLKLYFIAARVNHFLINFIKNLNSFTENPLYFQNGYNCLSLSLFY